ncbi:aldehyde dehydrogenase [Thalassospira sp. TSL5-1]|uniref:aldehyde dehydrogenase n=1 Tax=Thalassospira sp. TSL5-1 TaxID=1544451 RepID=UPI0011612C82|nr:aldehyde dehydrogenase [Thalassospira sp. TSL5-1]
MKNTILALVIAIGLVCLFFVGAAAGFDAAHQDAWKLFSDSTFRIQWEVLLTGIVAIAGAMWAYRGATYDIRHKTAVSAAGYLQDCFEVHQLLEAIDPATKMGREIQRLYENGDVKLVKRVANDAFEAMPKLPADLATKKNIDMYRKARSQVLLLSTLDKPREGVLKKARGEIQRFINVMENYADEV